MVGMISRSSSTLQHYHLLLDTHLQKYSSLQLKSSTLLSYHHLTPNTAKMTHTWILLLFAVCTLWTFGETIPCDQCGRECANICGTRQFRACCFNNMQKRHSDFGLRFWMRPRRYVIHPYLIYDA